MNFREFLTLEARLTQLLVKAWHAQSKSIYAAIIKAVEAEDWHKATQLVYELDMTDIGLENKDKIEALLLSCAVYGGNMANKKGASWIKSKEEFDKHYPVLKTATTQFLKYLEHGATEYVQTEMLQLIAEAETAAKTKILVSTQKVGEQPLYVMRPLLNCLDFVAWAKGQGFPSTLLPSDIHVTICFSRTPLEWGNVLPEIDNMSVVGGKRDIQYLGDKGAVVMTIESDELQKRWQDFQNAGASWDYDGYHPHLTITYQAPDGFDVGKVVPYTGLLEFGPEVYEPLDTEKDKVEKAERFVQPLVSFAGKARLAAEGGDQILGMTSALHSSRLSTWGFTAEAETRGVTRYRLTAVLDNRTSEFCRDVANGRIFEVATAREKILEVLSTTDPNDLRQIQPWPKQTKDSISAYEKMTDGELEGKGLGIPPFHPWCRTMLVLLSEDGGEEITSGVAPVVENPDIPRQDAEEDDFNAIGMNITMAELVAWNKAVNTLPNEALSAMTGMTEEQILASAMAGKAIQLNKDGTITFLGELEVGGGKTLVESMIDPLTGKLYLEKLDMIAGDAAAQAEYVAKVLNGMIDQGTSIGSKALYVDTGKSAFEYALMGFTPKANEWQAIRLKLIDDLEAGNMKALFKSLNDDEKASLLNILSNKHEIAAIELADFPATWMGKSVGEVLLQGHDVEFYLDLSNSILVARAKSYL